MRVHFGAKEVLLPAYEGAYQGKAIAIDQRDNVAREEVVVGNAYMLKNVAEGTQVFNIEIVPGDSGRLMKTAGSFATVMGHMKNKTKLMLPSKKEKFVLNTCRAFIGVIGGGGRQEKPILKAGLAWMESRKKNKLYPRVSGVKQNAVDHPHGGSRSLRKGRPTIAPHNAPPGRKVGMLRPRHTGRNK
jgi:large subunit ribosomal protein L2